MTDSNNIEELILSKTKWSEFQRDYAGSLIYEITDDLSDPIAHIIITRDYSKISIRTVNINRSQYTTSNINFNTKTNEIIYNELIRDYTMFIDLLDKIELSISNYQGIFHPFGTIGR